MKFQIFRTGLYFLYIVGILAFLFFFFIKPSHKTQYVRLPSHPMRWGNPSFRPPRGRKPYYSPYH